MTSFEEVPGHSHGLLRDMHTLKRLLTDHLSRGFHYSHSYRHFTIKANIEHSHKQSGIEFRYFLKEPFSFCSGICGATRWTTARWQYRPAECLVGKVKLATDANGAGSALPKLRSGDFVSAEWNCPTHNLVIGNTLSGLVGRVALPSALCKKITERWGKSDVIPTLQSSCWWDLQHSWIPDVSLVLQNAFKTGLNVGIHVPLSVRGGVELGGHVPVHQLDGHVAARLRWASSTQGEDQRLSLVPTLLLAANGTLPWFTSDSKKPLIQWGGRLISTGEVALNVTWKETYGAVFWWKVGNGARLSRQGFGIHVNIGEQR